MASLHACDSYNTIIVSVHAQFHVHADKHLPSGLHKLAHVLQLLLHLHTVSASLLTTSSIDVDRWHLVGPPSDDPSQGFQMHLIARQDIPEGQEVLLSYGDRNNDDFFLHYGFVPLRNPHDDAVLFKDLTEALDWHYDTIGSQVGNCTFLWYSISSGCGAVLCLMTMSCSKI